MRSAIAKEDISLYNIKDVKNIRLIYLTNRAF